jgi:hypothetical protein
MDTNAVNNLKEQTFHDLMANHRVQEPGPEKYDDLYAEQTLDDAYKQGKITRVLDVVI